MLSPGEQCDRVHQSMPSPLPSTTAHLWLPCRSNVTKILAGMETAKLQQVAIKAQVRNFIDTHQVVCTGPFVYAYVEEGTPNMKYFSRPLTLCKLARFLREAWTSSNKRACDYPFILSAPVDLEKGNLALFPLSSLLTRTHTHTPLMVQ
jgi:hypothetical protein